MAQINFPAATANGQTFEAPTGVVYTYVGTPPNGYWSGTFQSPVLTDLDTRYLKLDASNDPITGGLFINNYLGIGTSSPTGPLHVSSAGTTRFFIEGSDGRHEIRANNGTLSFFTNQDANASGNNNTIFYRNGNNESMRIRANGVINFASCPTYADDSAAGTGGLVAGDIYKTSAGDLKIKL